MMAPRPREWRNARQIRALAHNLQGAVDAANSEVIMIDITTARNLIEVCLQAAHEEGHGV